MKILVIFDLDETLLSSEGSELGVKELLEKLHQKGVTMAIASRNDFYVAVRKLETAGIKQYFARIAADFRPKGYQVRDLLRLFTSHNQRFDTVLFVDDTPSNIQSVSTMVPGVECVLVGERGEGIGDLEKIVLRYLEDHYAT